LDSWWQNLISHQRQRPTHHRATPVQAITTHSPLLQLADPWITSLIQHGADLPPPHNAPRTFQRTLPSPLMDQIIQDFLQQGILKEQEISAAYHSFLVAKSDQSARFVVDLSPLTPHYRVPHITLYSAARVLSTIQPFDTMLKFDLVSGFFQIPLRPEHRRF
jgi:hypothetical protein